MLELTVGGNEYYDEQENRFVKTKSRTLCLEHSLRSVAKWESKWKIAFLSTKQLTKEQSDDYIRCMETTGRADPTFVSQLSLKQKKEINEYISDSMTATVIHRRKKTPPSKKTITAELIYFWMIQNGIPPEYEKWHLNRLLTLIEVCSVEGGPKQKMSMKDQMAQQRALNESRLKKFNTRG